MAFIIQLTMQLEEKGAESASEQYSAKQSSLLPSAYTKKVQHDKTKYTRTIKILATLCDPTN